MAILDARQIYAICRQAGFSPNQSVTMTAIALAESSGNTDAHASKGEDSWGLFQVNLDAHGSWTNADQLRDPLENAKAAFRISSGGNDISPWTVTHQRNGTPYVKFRNDAIAAAAANGDIGAIGNFTGSEGYGHPTSAAPSDPLSLTPEHDDLTDHPVVDHALLVHHDLDAAAAEHVPDVDHFLYHALSVVGESYVYGAEADLDDPHPNAFDCSELVQWAAHQAGIDVGDVAQYQYLNLAHQGGEIPVEQALHTPGALLFWFPSTPTDGDIPPEGHVAISLGDGRTVEARGRDYGVGVFESTGRRFTQAALIPGLRYPTPDDLSRSPDFIDRIVQGLPGIDHDDPFALHDPAVDAHSLDHAGGDLHALADLPDIDHGLAFDSTADTDGDHIDDATELAMGLRADSADTDGDGYSDSIELALGHDPLVADLHASFDSPGLDHDVVGMSFDHWLDHDHGLDHGLDPHLDLDD